MKIADETLERQKLIFEFGGGELLIKVTFSIDNRNEKYSILCNNCVRGY